MVNVVSSDVKEAWYSRPDVLGNIIPLLSGREVAFLVPTSLKEKNGNFPIRCIKAHHSSYLLNNIRAFNFVGRNYNLYASYFLYNGMPMFSYSPLKRVEQQREFFGNPDKYIVGIDFVIDFDGDRELPINERIRCSQAITIKVVSLLEQYKIPFAVVFSGSKGFHIEVRGMPSVRDWRKRVKSYKILASNIVVFANGEKPIRSMNDKDFDRIKTLYSFDNCIYDVTSQWKVPYSLDVGSGLVAMPLTTEELLNFKIDDYRIENVMTKNYYGVGIKKRPGHINNLYLLAEELGVVIDG